MSRVDEITADLTDAFVAKLQEQISRQVEADVGRKLAQIDITRTVNEIVTRELDGLIKSFKFPENSIPGQAINTEKFLITGDHVVGGIIKNFGSTGIQDDATDCRVTILDDVTVIENKLVVPSLEVRGDLSIAGNFLVAGELQQQVAKQVASGVTAELAQIDLPTTVQDLAAKSAESYLNSIQGSVKEEINQVAKGINLDDLIKQTATTQTELVVKSLTSQITSQVQADIARLIGMLDIKQQIRDFVSTELNGMISNVSFPDNSIPGPALNLTNFTITGNNIVGGVIKNFGSTGIQDEATSCQVTILDQNTVFENKLVAPSAEIKGTLVVDGDIILTGEVPSNSPFYTDLVQQAAGLLKLSMDEEFFLRYANVLFDKFKKDGVDVSKLTLNEKEIVAGNRLGRSITDTNIQRLGELKSLTVRGESILANSLYVQDKRVGINTQEPSCALSVWDEECEVVTKKLRKNVSVVGSVRDQQVILSSNNKENLTLEIDGSVSIERLNVGSNVQLGSSSTRPAHNEKRGVILFNSNPEIGTPAFWISLGGARWVDGPEIS